MPGADGLSWLLLSWLPFGRRVHSLLRPPRANGTYPGRFRPSQLVSSTGLPPTGAPLERRRLPRVARNPRHSQDASARPTQYAARKRHTKQRNDTDTRARRCATPESSPRLDSPARQAARTTTTPLSVVVCFLYFSLLSLFLSLLSFSLVPVPPLLLLPLSSLPTPLYLLPMVIDHHRRLAKLRGGWSMTSPTTPVLLWGRQIPRPRAKTPGGTGTGPDTKPDAAHDSFHDTIQPSRAVQLQATPAVVRDAIHQAAQSGGATAQGYDEQDTSRGMAAPTRTTPARSSAGRRGASISRATFGETIYVRPVWPQSAGVARKNRAHKLVCDRDRGNRSRAAGRACRPDRARVL